MKKVNKFH